MSVSITPESGRRLSVRRGNVAQRKFVNRIMLILCILAATLAVTILGLVLFFLITKGFSFLHLSLFTKLPDNIDTSKGGMSQSIFGTLVLLGIASVIGLPLTTIATTKSPSRSARPLVAVPTAIKDSSWHNSFLRLLTWAKTNSRMHSFRTSQQRLLLPWRA